MNRADATTFKLVFPKIPTLTNIRDSNVFFIHLYNSVLPSISIESSELPWQGFLAHGGPTGVSYGDWSTGFFVDEDWENYIIMYDWMDDIRNGYDKHHGDRILDKQINAILDIMDNFNNSVVQFEFVNIWPSSLGEVSLSYQEGENILSCDTTFTYDYFRKLESA